MLKIEPYEKSSKIGIKLLITYTSFTQINPFSVSIVNKIIGVDLPGSI